MIPSEGELSYLMGSGSCVVLIRKYIPIRYMQSNTVYAKRIFLLIAIISHLTLDYCCNCRLT